MSMIVVGLNHKTAPISLLERLAVSSDEVTKALHQLRNYEHIVEGAILSTCNRVEVYATVSKYHGGAQDLRNFLAEFRHVPPEDFADHLYTYFEEGAVRHLFRVAAGIDSLVIGESEILGQVRRAHQVGVEEGALGRRLGTAFVRAVRTGRRARSETGINRNPASISSAAVELVRRAFDGTLADRTVALIGAGKMGRLTAQALRAAGVGDVVVVNRSLERGGELAELFDARAVPFDQLAGVLVRADIVISSTTSMQPVIERPTVEAAVARKSSPHPLFIVDIAVPRDVDPEVAQIDGVIVKDIEDLREVVETSVGGRAAEISGVEAIIAEEAESFLAWESARAAVPVASALVEKMDAIRAEEIERIRTQLDSMTPEQRNAVDHLARRLVAKILHSPLARSREFAATNQGQMYLTALKELFQLDDED